VARSAPDMRGMDLVKFVTCRRPMLWLKGKPVEIDGSLDDFIWPCDNGKWRVVAIDYGVKYNILRSLEKYDCNIIIVPADTDSDTINKLKPDGIF
jgi:carbamoyl-phosphate synthase small subunit